MFEFNTKEEYLQYREDWKKEYKELSSIIHNLKKQRKQFKWEYREKGDQASKRKTKAGDNPSYNPNAAMKAANLGNKATTLLAELHEAKAYSWELRQKAQEKAA